MRIMHYPLRLPPPVSPPTAHRPPPTAHRPPPQTQPSPFMAALVGELSNAAREQNSRQLAGLYLKNMLTVSTCREKVEGAVRV